MVLPIIQDGAVDNGVLDSSVRGPHQTPAAGREIPTPLLVTNRTHFRANGVEVEDHDAILGDESD